MSNNPDLDGAMGSIWLHGRWRDLTRHMTTEEREAAAAAVERWHVSLGDDEPLGESSMVELRWWADPYVEIEAAYQALTACLDHGGSGVDAARLRMDTAMRTRPRMGES